MHGIIFNQLFKFLRENHGQETLHSVLTKAELKNKFYDTTKSHPDEDLEKIISTACEMLDAKRDDILEVFGEYIVPGLLQIYGSFIKKEWDVLDLLENIEGTIHRAIRMNDTEATPPELKIERTGQDSVVIIYSSARKMVHLGVGIVRAIGKHFKLNLKINKVNVSKDVDKIEVSR